MNSMKVTLALPLVLLAAACGRGYEAESEPAPSVSSSSALDPVGVYDFTATLGGETRTGTIQVERTASGFGGQAMMEGETHAAVVDSVRVNGQNLVINLTVPGDPVSFDLNFTGNSFTGFIFAGGDAITVWGAKREP